MEDFWKSHRLFEWFLGHERKAKLAALPFLLVMMAGVSVLVYMTGGIKYVYSHSMYLPIILGGLIYGRAGGVLLGLLGGLLLGPFMPIDVAIGERQDVINWLYRTGFFTAVGFIIGAASHSARAYLERINFAARHDALSGLPNRYALIETLRRARKTPPGPQALAIVSLENSDELKVALGLSVVDDIISQLAFRITGLHRDGLEIFRFSMHQLGVLFYEKGDHGWGVRKIQEDLPGILDHPFEVNGLSIHADIRIGYTEMDGIKEDAELYLRRCEMALDTAARDSRMAVRFEPELESDRAKNNISLLGALNEALKKTDLGLHFQPKVMIASGEICGAEVLLRWEHPDLYKVTLEGLILRAEQSTLIDHLTEWIVDSAVAQLARWHREGMELPLSVNVSARNLQQPEFVETVGRILKTHGVKGESLELEVTEGALMHDPGRIRENMHTLGDLGVSVAIDDFGTGYSSLQYLSMLPATVVKIDKGFVREALSDEKAASLVRAAVNLGHGMGLLVTAEGVETHETYRFLEGIGCDIAQGFFIGHPVSAGNFARWFRERKGRFVPGSS